MLRMYVNIVKPLINRLGTIAATALIAYGIDADTAGQIANGMTAFVFVLFDLWMESRNREGR
ncbi:MAG: hypothetical protein WBA15_12450 [Mesorhizobium sp.]